MSTIAISTFAPSSASTHQAPSSAFTHQQARSQQRHLRAVPAPRTQSGLRLTRRGRLVVFLVAASTVLLLAIGFGGATIATDHAGTPAAASTVTVQAGQTLWEIAVAANPNGDIRQTVDEIMELNSLPSAGGLQMGREIAVPIYK